MNFHHRGLSVVIPYPVSQPREETTMESAKETLLDWLRDAHAMEQQGEKMLTHFSDRIDDYPELKERINAHILATREQQELLRDCLEKQGGTTSKIKDLGAKLMGFTQGMSGIFVSDEVVKGAMSVYVFKQLEIASYTVLIAAARQTVNTRTLEVCEQILPQEVAMAMWLQNYLPEVTNAFIARTRAV